MDSYINCHNLLDLWVFIVYYITMKNTHLEHPEDSILNQGRTGAINVLKWFADKNSSLTVKYDGAPAIVWGINPECGRFFVGTKSVFNKIKVKINYTHRDIEDNHGATPAVASILHMCLDKLPHKDGVFQGDFIGYGGYDEYTPNTITYKFLFAPTQDIVFAAHTEYFGNSMKTMNAKFMSFNEDDNVIQSDTVRFLDTKAQIKTRKNKIGLLIGAAKVLIRFTSFTDEKIGAYVKQVINSYIRSGKDLVPSQLAQDTGLDVNLFHLYKLIIEIKELLMDGITDYEDVDCYIGDKPCEHEGYVMTNTFGTYKLVKREIFSYNNFNAVKNWSK